MAQGVSRPARLLLGHQLQKACRRCQAGSAEASRKQTASRARRRVPDWVPTCMTPTIWAPTSACFGSNTAQHRRYCRHAAPRITGVQGCLDN